MATEFKPKNHPVESALKTVAVIDIGASSVRMAIAEISGVDSVRLLENLSQAVNLGRDSFHSGKLSQKTIEDCVHVLKIYRQKLDEYQITSKDCIRVVATSAVREATNRLAFHDRIFIATGFEIEPFDVAELHRVTYVGILPVLDQIDPPEDSQNIVCEIGGGSTEMLILNNRDVSFWRTFRAGSLRMRQKIQALNVPVEKMRSLLEPPIKQIVSEVKEQLLPGSPKNFIAMGSEIRFVASELLHKNPADEIVKIDVDTLHEFNSEISKLTPEKLARRFPLSVPDAETLVLTLLSYESIARETNMEYLIISNVNLRDGLLTEMGMGGVWQPSIERQIFNSAISVGRKYHFDEDHAKHVAEISRQMFDQLRDLHQLGRRYRSILYLASLLHEIGQYVSSRSFHKHSMFLIRNSEFFGIGAEDQLMIALVARYHRRAQPQQRHEGYGSLERDERVAISKLSAILRIAKALDASRSQTIGNVNCKLVGNRLVLQVENVSDPSLAQFELHQNSEFFESIFGHQVVLENVKTR